MSEFHKAYDGEIDFFTMIAILWEGKWFIFGFAALAALIGLGYLQVTQPKFKVSASYTLNIYPVFSQPTCDYNMKPNMNCMERSANQRLLSLLGGDWDKDKKSSTLFFSTSTSSDGSEYEAQVERANTLLTNEIYLDATRELAFIQTEMSDALLNTERVATNYLNAKRTIEAIDRGQSAITLRSLSVVRSSPKAPIILALATTFGGLIGVFFFVVRNTIKMRKQLLAKG